MNETLLRDELAIERTHLANERTFLAYIRTALALSGAGAVVLHFFSSHSLLFGVSWLLIAAGALTVLIGAYRFVAVRKRLNN